MPDDAANCVTGHYWPTKGDRAFVAAMRGPNPSHALDRAVLIRRVSDAYLASLASANAANGPGGLKALTDIELARRAQRPARRANWLAGAAIGIAAVSLLVSVYVALWPSPKPAASLPRHSLASTGRP